MLSLVLGILYFQRVGHRMASHYTPMLKASNNIKQNITSAHLWTEEVILGTSRVPLDSVKSHMDRAMALTEAMLEGGNVKGNKIFPLTDSILREKMQITQRRVKKFHALILQRWPGDVGSGNTETQPHSRFNRLYQQIVQTVDQLEFQLHQRFKRELSRFRFLQFLLLGILIVIVIYTTLLVYRFTRERNQTLQEIAENENNLRITLKSIGDAVITTDLNGKITRINQIARELTGYFEGEALGQAVDDILMLYHTQTREKIKNPVNLVLQTGKTAGLANDTLLKSKDGREYQIADSGAPITDAKGNIHGVVLVFRDISEAYQRQKQIRESEAKYRKFFKTSRDAVFITTVKGRWIDMNDATVELLGYSSKQELMETPVQQIYYRPEDRKEHTSQIISKGFTREYPVDLVKKDGTLVHALITSVPFYDSSGHIEGFQGTIHDHTYIQHTEETLRQERNKLRQLTETSPVSILLMDERGSLNYANQRARDVLDLDDDALESHRCMESQWQITDMNGNPVPRDQLPFEQVKKTGKPVYGNEFTFTQSNGRQLMVQVNAAPIFGGSNHLKGVVATLENITRRKENEKRIHHLNSVLDAIRKINQLIIKEQDRSTIIHQVGHILTGSRNFTNSWIALLDEHHQITMTAASNLNQQFPAFREKLAEGFWPQCLNRVIHQKTTFIPDKQIHCHACPLADLYQETGTICLPLKHGKKIFGMLNVTLPVEMTADPEEKALLEEMAHDIGFALFNIELRETKARMEASLMESERKFRTLMENAFDGIYLTRSRHFEYVNHRFCEITGYTAGELTSSEFNFYDLLTPESKNLVAQRYQARQRQEKIPNRYEMRIYTEAGELKDVELSTVSLESGNEVTVMGIMRDVTQRKMAERELLKAKEKAEESDRLKTAFLANMSHEIRTPMNGVVGFTKLLKQKDFPKNKQKEFLDIIDSRANHLLDLINDIIDISKIEAGQVHIEHTRFSLNEMMDELYQMHSNELQNKSKNNITLNLHKAFSDASSEISSDQLRLKQILTNLLSNAVKFTSSGTIEFGYEPAGNNGLMFYVEDTGPGIPQEKQKLIFNRFRQADESSSKSFGGTGLGLAISKNLVEMLGGSIEVESEENRGTTFRFTLPYQPAITSNTSQSAPAHSNLSQYDNLFEGFQILVIEDDPISKQFISEILQPTGAVLHFAEKATLGYRRYFKLHKQIDLILMDLRLPDISGLDITRRIRALDKNLPIIAQTAYAMSEDREKCLQAGCNDYLAKPTDQFSLLAKLQAYLK